MNFAWTLAMALAQNAAPQQAPQQSPFIAMAPLLIVFFVFYFLVIRPQSKKQKEHDTMLQELKKGDRVLTAGGFYGRVFAIKDDLVVLTVSENVKLEMAKSAITRVVE